MEATKLTEKEQRRAVLSFVESRLVTYGDAEGLKGETIAGHATFSLGVRDGRGRNVLIAFRVLKGTYEGDEEYQLNEPKTTIQVEVENQQELEHLMGVGVIQ